MINYIGRTILDVIFGETFLHLDLTRLENLVTAADFLITLQILKGFSKKCLNFLILEPSSMPTIEM
jgi:hypothetical protein